MEEFDLVVIGGGAAGEKGAVQAGYFGKRVALVEKQPALGGAMVNTGTLPSKTLRETALYLSGFRQRGLHGVDLAITREASVDDFLYRLEQVVAVEHRRIARNLEKHGVVRIEGAARFVDAHTIAVEGPAGPRTLKAKHVLVATGSTPLRPAAFPFDHPFVYDSDEIVRVHTIPKAMTVVGGGVIGCEYACLFAALGARVTLIESRETILGFLDAELVQLLTGQMKRLGVDFRMPAQVSSCAAGDHGVTLTLQDGAKVQSDLVLICAGRQGATAGLDVEKAGLTPTKRGALEVDAKFQTNVPHIAAVGDVIGFPALASTSMEQARVAVVHFFDLKYKTSVANLFPYGIYTIPEVSMVGDTEEALKEKKIDYVRGVADFSSNARGLMVGAEGCLKLLFRREDMKLLGAHCIGEGATELIHVALMAMMNGASASLFIEACFNYPTMSEAYKYAAYDALGKRER